MTPYRPSILTANHFFDAATGCWRRHGSGTFEYSDGDEVEERIFRIVRDAVDTGSTSLELRGHITDWASMYHLGIRRANLLRPLEHLLKERQVLEVGAGCGAITRFLAESGAQVLAVEGSIRRAMIAAARCRGMDNVTVVADSFHRLTASSAFDVVTLIGVLEYARIYFPAEKGDPVDAMLAHARSFLRPGGILILAIENQLGLKYFAGYREDHIGIPMYGIEDLYSDTEFVTFGRRDLCKRLAAAGLPKQSWWFPFPDYKHPVSVFSERATSLDIDISPVLAASVSADYQRPPCWVFSLEQAWQAVARNGLLGDLANSFLVLASDAADFQDECGVIGYHYAVERRPEFAKRLVFRLTDGGRMRIHKERLFPKAVAAQDSPLTICLEDEDFVRPEFDSPWAMGDP